MACRSSNDETTESSPVQTLRMSIGGSPQTIDPHQVSGSVGMNVIAALSEGLLALDYTTMDLKPAAAKRWEVSEDGLRYYFYLQPDARWSNGEPLTAQDFVYSWQRILSPRLGNPFVSEYFAIRNAEAFHSGLINDPAKVGVEAVSANELVIHLHRQDPLFLLRMTSALTAPIHKTTIEKFGAFDDPSNAWVKAGNYVGNGPFKLVRWELNQTIEVKRNQHYWDKANILLDEVHFNPVETETAAEHLYRVGQIDLVFGRRVPAEKIAKYKSVQPAELFSQSDYGSYYYLFNTTKPPFDDANVRKALVLAVNRELIVKRITQSGEKIARSLNPQFSGYQPPEGLDYDPLRARALLAKAGYANGEGFPSVGLLYNTIDTHRKIAVAIQQMWKQELNIDVVLENQEWKVFLNTRKHLQFDIARAGMTSLLADPSDFLNAFTSDHGSNDSGWRNAQFDRLLTDSNQQNNKLARFALLQQAETILLDDMPILPIFYYSSTYLKAPKVKGFSFNMLAQPEFKGVYIQEVNK